MIVCSKVLLLLCVVCFWKQKEFRTWISVTREVNTVLRLVADWWLKRDRERHWPLLHFCRPWWCIYCSCKLVFMADCKSDGLSYSHRSSLCCCFLHACMLTDVLICKCVSIVKMIMWHCNYFKIGKIATHTCKRTCFRCFLFSNRREGVPSI